MKGLLSKVITSCLMMVLVITLSGLTAKAAENEIIITTPEELMAFAEDTQDGTLGNCADRIVKLGNDIDMAGYDWYYRDAEGTVVTDYRIPDFIGTLDGQGYAIKNLTFRDDYKDTETLNSLAFIIQGKSVIKNLTIDGITVNTKAPAYFAGLVKDFAWSGSSNGYADNCFVKNVVVNADADFTFGGMFYRLVGGKEITNCHVENITVNVKGKLVGDNSGRNGGFVATGCEPMKMENCSVTNLVVNSENTGKYLGGFVGGASMSASFYNCSVNGFELNATNNFSVVGGFAGFTAGSAWGSGLILEDCEVTGLDINNTAKITAAGGFIGYVYGYGKSLADGAHHFTRCTAEGIINAGDESKAGGFIGWLYGRSGGCAVDFDTCEVDVDITTTGFGGAFAGYYVPSGSNVIVTAYNNCTAYGDVFANEPAGSFVDADETTIDGVIGGTYNYDPSANVAEGYNALNNGDGTWTVFANQGKEVVTITFHRFNDETGEWEAFREVEVFAGTAFVNPVFDNEDSKDAYRFEDGLATLNEMAAELTDRIFVGWTLEDSIEIALDEEIVITEGMDVFSLYGYEVSYEYTGTVPENAPALPETEVYIAGADVTVAEIPTMDGFEFSGWDVSVLEDGKMPEENVVITGSFTMTEVEIEDEETPKVELPEVPENNETEDEKTEDSKDQTEVEIEDEEVPKTEAPKTGDNHMSLVVLTVIAGMALLGTCVATKKHTK